MRGRAKRNFGGGRKKEGGEIFGADLVEAMWDTQLGKVDETCQKMEEPMHWGYVGAAGALSVLCLVRVFFFPGVCSVREKDIFNLNFS